jgi:D-sedoheptulose 7-phosphate isomerase
MNPTSQFLHEVQEIASKLDAGAIERMVGKLVALRNNGGRLFFLGIGGSAANASHAVNDFRKIADIECYAPTDNIAELTARTNDEGWATTFSTWLNTSRLCEKDALFILSVSGGDLVKNFSPNLVEAIKLARTRNAAVLGIVGGDGGYTALVGDVVVIIPTVNPGHVTPHSEAFQAVIWHLLVSHPLLKKSQTKWEGSVLA